MRSERAPALSEWFGVLIAIVSSCLRGTAAAVTRYLVGDADPITIAILRWGIGFLCVLPVAVILRVRWPKRSDRIGVAALGISFFGLFFHSLQHRCRLHDGSEGESCARPLAAADHGRCLARNR
jgi:integral membrane sensor domain MASE1